jgi:hypothetical protein
LAGLEESVESEELAESVASAVAIECRPCHRVAAAIGSIIPHTVAAPPIETGQLQTGSVVQLGAIPSPTVRPVLVNSLDGREAISLAIVEVEEQGSAIELAADLETDRAAAPTALVAVISRAPAEEIVTHSEEARVGTTEPMRAPAAAEAHRAWALAVAGEALAEVVAVAVAAADEDNGRDLVW